MTSTVEQKIRQGLPVVRFFQSYLPPTAANWLIRRGMARLRLPADISRETVSADGVPCERLVPADAARDRVLLYLHGGGFVYGLTPPHMTMVAQLVRLMKIPAVVVDYRVAPTHPFPAALDDCVTAYRWLLKQGWRAANIVLAGDSAGGNLAITTMMRLRDSGDALPAAAACLSPAADLSEKTSVGPAYNDPLLPARAIAMYRRSYVAGNDARNPFISPVFGDWRGLPPLLVHVGEDEILRDDAQRIADLGRVAGLDVRLEVYPRMWHVWQLNLELPEAAHSLADIAQFLRSHLPQSAAHTR